jgi:hypothetical protein
MMLRAATISSQAHARAMRAARPGMFEYELEAELLYEFRRNGAQAPAYNSIVAAGANACVLHYSANNAQSRDGDLVLIDAGCELDGYASDITRTWPVNGRFSAPQKRLYELVLAAQAAALKAIAPGLPYSGAHEAAVQVLTQGMLDLGLLDRNAHGSVADIIADKRHLQFYMHGTGHWLGMDVHDVGQYRDVGAAGKPSRALQAGHGGDGGTGHLCASGRSGARRILEHRHPHRRRCADHRRRPHHPERSRAQDRGRDRTTDATAMTEAIYDVAICGAGPAGMALAALLVKRGMPAFARIALIDAKTLEQAGQDPRSLALSWGSRQILEQIGAWPGAATAIEQIHVSRRGQFGRSLIDRKDYGLEALGYVNRYGNLVSALGAESANAPAWPRCVRPAWNRHG